MNITILIGRLTRDPELNYTTSGTAVCKFTLAVDRPTKAGEEKSADFVPVEVWGRLAETCNTYLQKGHKCAVRGKIRTGSYKGKDGKTVYTTNVTADNVEFIQARERPSEREIPRNPETTFMAVTDEVPF